MVVEYIRYDLGQNSAEALIAAYAVASESLRAAPECLGYQLARCEEAPSSFILRIDWRSTEEHLQGFRKGPHFPAFLAAIRPFIGEIAEMRHYLPTQLEWTR
ncbi:putative quinol monooxygenase [Plastoroseomonas arctica]|uniref:Antibiotic biosynthesis monooxygenase n=1 Tax=Plastoroseomonas arctica TaxID=1509237 RepID=A0AAF1JVX6_9PROT|nr:antibiotic biosynthesis monooxygenase [Plastoroseomonas arctica]MBR0654895.1 antibiotic biosynthesis monooxygenase [Plastoroseomonas arctica]